MIIVVLHRGLAFAMCAPPTELVPPEPARGGRLRFAADFFDDGGREGQRSAMPLSLQTQASHAPRTRYTDAARVTHRARAAPHRGEVARLFHSKRRELEEGELRLFPAGAG